MDSKNKMIITDNIDLSTKTILTQDEFYKENKNSKNITISDFRSLDSSQIEKKSDMVYYALVSSSNKIINNRNYDDQSWLKTVKDKKWLMPYKKPILYNHDLYFSTPHGRIENAFYINHQNKEVISSIKEKLPEEVVDYYDSIGAFNNGTSSVIARISADEWLSNRIENDIDLTVSQSSFMNKAICNICGNDYYGDSCPHFPGREYEVEVDGKKEKKVCVVNTFDYEPIELSFVNLPANDTSVVFKMTKNNNVNNITPSDNVEENNAKVEDKKVNNQDLNQIENKNKEEGGKEDPVENFKDVLKQVIESKIQLSDELKEPFQRLFDSMNSEQVKDFITLLEQLQEKKEQTVDASKETEVKEQESKNVETTTNDSNETNEVVKEEQKEQPTNDLNEQVVVEEKTVEQTSTTDAKEEKFSSENPISKFFNNDEKTVKTKIDNEMQALINACIEEE